MIKKGFNFFQTKNAERYLEVENLEITYNFKFPPLFRLFANSFELGEKKLQEEKYLNKFGNLSNIGSILYPTEPDSEPIFLQKFFDLNSILLQWTNAKEDIEWSNHKLIRIATLGQVGFGGLYLGCDEKNFDEIWQFCAEDDIQFKKIDDNIFEFVKKLEFSYGYSNIEQEDYDKLVKLWNQNYWILK